MVDLAELQVALEKAGNPWRAAETPVASIVASSEGDGNVFGLAITEPERHDLLARAEQMESESPTLAAADTPPPAVDWREGKWTAGVRSQLTCQSCVAFATCAVLEARLRIFADRPGMDVDLSESHLFACGNPGGCTRGWTFEPALEQAQRVGIGSEADFPYQPVEQPCREVKPVAQVTGWLAATTTDARKQLIAANGPVIGGMRTFEDFLSYRGGVYRHVLGESTGLHAVCVVGYDDDDEVGCWIIKNSWSAEWGEAGFGRIAYGECGLGDEFPFFDPDVRSLA